MSADAPLGATRAGVFSDCKVSLCLSGGGQLWSRGASACGQTGGGGEKSWGKVDLGGAAAAAMSHGCQHAAVLTAAGEVRTWGMGGLGRLGQGEQASLPLLKCLLGL